MRDGASGRTRICTLLTSQVSSSALGYGSKMARLVGTAPTHNCLKNSPPALSVKPQNGCQPWYRPKSATLQRRVCNFYTCWQLKWYACRVTLPVEADIYGKGFIKPSWNLIHTRMAERRRLALQTLSSPHPLAKEPGSLVPLAFQKWLPTVDSHHDLT